MRRRAGRRRRLEAAGGGHYEDNAQVMHKKSKIRYDDITIRLNEEKEGKFRTYLVYTYNYNINESN